MKIAVAIVPSNQDRNISKYQNKTEMSGMAVLAKSLDDLLSNAGIYSRVFTGKPESKDPANDHLSGLIVQTASAANHLEQLDKTGQFDKLICLHLHSDAPGPAHTLAMVDTTSARWREAQQLGRTLASACMMAHPVELGCVVHERSVSGYVFGTRGYDNAVNLLVETFTHADEASAEWFWTKNGDTALAQSLADVLFSIQPQSCVTFSETGYKVCHGFLSFYRSLGDRALEVLGYPISNEMDEHGMTVQYFERCKMEYHPDDTEQTVKLAHLGRLAMEKSGTTPTT